MCSEEIVNFQISLAKQIISKTQGMAEELQLAVYNNVCTDIRQRRIERQKAAQNGFRTASEMNKDPSEKQLKYARELGITEPEQYTKKELSRKIEEKRKGGQ